jgi:hypothetical protein
LAIRSLKLLMNAFLENFNEDMFLFKSSVVSNISEDLK